MRLSIRQTNVLLLDEAAVSSIERLKQRGPWMAFFQSTRLRRSCRADDSKDALGYRPSPKWKAQTHLFRERVHKSVSGRCLKVARETGRQDASDAAGDDSKRSCRRRGNSGERLATRRSSPPVSKRRRLLSAHAEIFCTSTLLELSHNSCRRHRHCPRSDTAHLKSAKLNAR